MIDERDHVAFAGDARMADPAAGFVEPFPGRIFEAIPSIDIAHDCELRTVGRPVGPLDIFQNLAGRATSERHASQRSGKDLGLGLLAAQQDCHLSCRGDRENLSSWNSGGTRFWRTKTRVE